MVTRQALASSYKQSMVMFSGIPKAYVIWGVQVRAKAVEKDPAV